jgi:hypothetical protein
MNRGEEILRRSGEEEDLIPQFLNDVNSIALGKKRPKVV